MKQKAKAKSGDKQRVKSPKKNRSDLVKMRQHCKFRLLKRFVSILEILMMGFIKWGRIATEVVMVAKKLYSFFNCHFPNCYA